MLQSSKIHNGIDGPETLGIMHNLAKCLRELGKYSEAKNLLEETVKLKSRVQGPEHEDTLLSKNNLANLLKALGNLKESKIMHESVYNSRLNKSLWPE